ncbi:MAG: hypothetical protein JXE07_08795, partial [Candidatus Aminicenantes bacterium]|nr:hypothetical protein [Candidatus Aminicenantes bacterium]
FVFVSAFYQFLWGWRQALLHSFFGLAAALLLLEGLFWRYQKIPFCCTFVPGKAKVHVFWLPYVFGFFLYVSILSSFERFMFSHPHYALHYFIACGVVIAGSQLYQNFYHYRGLDIVYHEEPKPIMITLQASP